jgi:hypothetical protein
LKSDNKRELEIARRTEVVNRGDLRQLGVWIDVQKPGGEDKDNRLREGENCRI